MIRRLDEGGDLAPDGAEAGTFEYRQLDVCVPNIGILAALDKLIFSKLEGRVFEDGVELAKVAFGELHLGSSVFNLVNESVSGRFGPTMSIMALTDNHSNIPVFQDFYHSNKTGPSFVRCDPRARIIRRSGEVIIELPEGPAMAIYRKVGRARVNDFWVIGNIYVEVGLPDAAQADLIAILTILALASAGDVFSRPLL